MHVLMILPLALKALRRHAMRTVLTMLGVIIGVSAVICTIAIGEGASGQIRTAIANIGANLVWVEAGGVNRNGVRTGTGGTRTLTVADLMAIRQQITTVTNVSPQADTRVQLVNGNQNWNTSVRGVSPEYITLKNWPVVTAACSRNSDRARRPRLRARPDCRVILFGDQDPIGQTIRVQGLPCAVIGVLGIKGQTATGQDQDDTLLMPYTTVMKKIKGTPWLDDIMMSALSADAVAAAEAQLTELLRARITSSPARRTTSTFGIRRRSPKPLPKSATHDGSAAGERRLGVAAGRRRRHHEHHAGVGDRAHARDRPAPGGRRARPRRAAPVPARGRAAQPRRRRASASLLGWAVTCDRRVSCSGRRASHSPRCCSPSRLPPRSACSSVITPPAGRSARPDRRPALRVSRPLDVRIVTCGASPAWPCCCCSGRHRSGPTTRGPALFTSGCGEGLGTAGAGLPTDRRLCGGQGWHRLFHRRPTQPDPQDRSQRRDRGLEKRKRRRARHRIRAGWPLVSGQHDRKRIVALDPNGKETIVAEGVQTHHLTITKRGAVYCADAPNHTIWLIDPAGSRRPATSDVNWPHVVLLSPDQSQVVVTDPHTTFVWSFRILLDGSLSHGQQFYHLEMRNGSTETDAGGMTFDTEEIPLRRHECRRAGIRSGRPPGSDHPAAARQRWCLRRVLRWPESAMAVCDRRGQDVPAAVEADRRNGVDGRDADAAQIACWCG